VIRARPIDNRFGRIFETSRLRHNVDLSQLPDCDYLGFALPGPDDVANRLAEQRPGQRRRVRYRSVGRIGFVLADDAKALLVSVIANDRHGISELDRGIVGMVGDKLRSGAPGAPVAEIPSGVRECAAIARRLGRAILSARGLQRGVDQPQTIAGGKIWVVRNRPIRQILDEMIFVYNALLIVEIWGFPRVSQGYFYTREVRNRSARAAFPEGILRKA
jgi:hypothetical protein